MSSARLIPMPQIANKPGARRGNGVGWLAAAVLAVLLVLANEIVGESGYLARRQQVQRIQELNAQIEQLKTENQRLTQKIDGLRDNPATIEEMAREQLHLGRPGEVVVALPPPPATHTPSQ
jgi:cell division protein FtsB